MRSVTLTPHRRSFVVAFKHPLKDDELIRRGTGTRDPNEATIIKRDLEEILNKPELHTFNEHTAATYHGKAVEIFYERTVSKVAANTDGTVDAVIHGRDLPPPDDMAAAIVVLWRDLDALKKLHQSSLYELQVRRKRESELEAEVAGLRLLNNKHVTITLKDAATQFMAAYRRTGVTVKSAQHVERTINQFLEAQPPELLLSQVTTATLDQYLSSLLAAQRYDKATGEPLPREPISQVTRRDKKVALSSLFKWCKKKFNLASNPALDMDHVRGVQRGMDSVVAFTRLTDLQSFLAADFPEYWQAWTHVALLAGLRFSEMVYLRVQDVDLDSKFIHVRKHEHHRVKTGRERRVPIERTTLLPVLKSYMPTITGRWVFPSIVDGGTVERTQTPLGTWSDNSTWQRNYKDAVAKVSKADPAAAFWTWGPREWRHSAGTLFGMVGKSAIEIARMLGNEAATAEQYYVSDLNQEARWPFQFS